MTFTLGPSPPRLFSGFLMAFWLPLLADVEPPLDDKTKSWIKMAGAAFPGEQGSMHV